MQTLTLVLVVVGINSARSRLRTRESNTWKTPLCFYVLFFQTLDSVEMLFLLSRSFAVVPRSVHLRSLGAFLSQQQSAPRCASCCSCMMLSKQKHGPAFRPQCNFHHLRTSLAFYSSEPGCAFAFPSIFPACTEGALVGAVVDWYLGVGVLTLFPSIFLSFSGSLASAFGFARGCYSH